MPPSAVIVGAGVLGASLADRLAGDGWSVDLVEADRVVWACGAWLSQLFAGLPELELRITQQDVFFFGADAAWTAPGVPGWVDYDTRFLAAPHPEHGGRVWLVGGGSGHAFKHGPALAEQLAPMIAGEAAPDPHLRLGARAPDRGLRTAATPS